MKREFEEPTGELMTDRPIGDPFAVSIYKTTKKSVIQDIQNIKRKFSSLLTYGLNLVRTLFHLFQQ